ncbi:MAG: RNA polymerase sigma factor [Myxococcales bacterium]
MKALRAGYPEAVRVLSERHFAELLRIAARILGPDAMLKAVVTEAMRRALTKLEELEDPTKLKVWLTSRVVAACRARLRWRRYFGWIIPTKPRENLAGALGYSEQLLGAYRVLDRIADRQRVVFCLVIIHAMSLAEVSTVLGLSLISARSILDRACRDFARLSENEPSISRLKLRSA